MWDIILGPNTKKGDCFDPNTGKARNCTIVGSVVGNCPPPGFSVGFDPECDTSVILLLSAQIGACIDHKNLTDPV